MAWTTMQFADLFGCLWDDDGGALLCQEILLGHNIYEWLSLFQHDYDWVDRLYVEYETIGGG